MPILNDLISLEEADALNAAVANLNVKFRIPVVLAYFNQFSYEEIAEQLQISRNHVGVLPLRAKQQLRTALATDSGAPNP